MTKEQAEQLMREPIRYEDVQERSVHFVEGHKSKKENPHWWRLGGQRKVSGEVRNWLKKLPDEPSETFFAKLVPGVDAAVELQKLGVNGEQIQFYPAQEEAPSAITN